MARTAVTRAIILRVIEHGDRSMVVRALTEAHGPRAFVVRPTGKKVPRALLQPLMRVEMIATDDPGRELQYVNELRNDRPYGSLHSDPMRAVVGVFVQEVLCQALRMEAPDPDLFAYVQHELEELDRGGPARAVPVGLGRTFGRVAGASRARRAAVRSP